MEQTQKQKQIDWFFRISIFLKGVISFVETVSGILVLTVPTFLIGVYLIWMEYTIVRKRVRYVQS